MAKSKKGVQQEIDELKTTLDKYQRENTVLAETRGKIVNLKLFSIYGELRTLLGIEEAAEKREAALTDFVRCKALLERFNIAFDVEDLGGEFHVIIGTGQNPGATTFVFEEQGGKFQRYETPLVDSCLTRREG